MIDSRGRSSTRISREPLLTGKAVSQDAEAALAANLRAADDAGSSTSSRIKKRVGRLQIAQRPETLLGRVAAQIIDSVEARLPGRIRDLQVRVEQDQFVLTGVSSSYYVKQVAQHVAMNALNALMLGRLVNEIQVRSMR